MEIGADSSSLKTQLKFIAKIVISSFLWQKEYRNEIYAFKEI